MFKNHFGFATLSFDNILDQNMFFFSSELWYAIFTSRKKSDLKKKLILQPLSRH